jgi:hypothetical protein
MSVNTDPWIIVPPKDWMLPQWAVLLLAALSITIVTILVIHGIAAPSTMSLLHAVLGTWATLAWIGFRREGPETARVADAMVMVAQFFLLRLALPAAHWLGW